MMEILAYGASALIGVSLGLIGGGGSILTLPVLVYLFGIDPLMATSYSLFIVGTTSLAGAAGKYRKGLVSPKTAFLFGTGSVTTVWMTRKYLVPAIPKHLLQIRGLEITSGLLTMVLFALLMGFAAVAMIRSGRNEHQRPAASELSPAFGRLLGYGVGIGLATGFFGAGGGFLLIPTLVLLVGLPMDKAIGTSLMIIALNSLIGFTGDLGHYRLNWPLLISVTLTATGGVFIGNIIGQKINGSRLKAGFGWFVLLMGIYIIARELSK